MISAYCIQQTSGLFISGIQPDSGYSSRIGYGKGRISGQICRQAFINRGQKHSYTGKGKCAVVYYKEQNMSLLPILAHTDWATCLPWPDRSHPTALAPDFWSPAARCASGKNPAQWWGNTAWCTGQQSIYNKYISPLAHRGLVIQYSPCLTQKNIQLFERVKKITAEIHQQI